MKLAMAVVSLFLGFSATAATNRQLADCLKEYAKRSIPEYNLPNQVVFSPKSQIGLENVSSALKKGFGMTPSYLNKGLQTLSNAQAMGAIIVYQDEVQLVYVGINFINNRCQVKQALDVNTVDIDYPRFRSGTEILNFFFGYKKNQLNKEVQEMYGYLLEDYNYAKKHP